MPGRCGRRQPALRWVDNLPLRRIWQAWWRETGSLRRRGRRSLDHGRWTGKQGGLLPCFWTLQSGEEFMGCLPAVRGPRLHGFGNRAVNVGGDFFIVQAYGWVLKWVTAWIAQRQQVVKQRAQRIYVRSRI